MMMTVLLIVHLFVTLALIGVVLIQRSEGGGLGIGSTQGMGSFMTGRGTANLLTRATAILATLFFALSLGLALMNRGTAGAGRSILDVPAPAPVSDAGRPVIPGAVNSGPAAASPTKPAPATALPPAPPGPGPDAACPGSCSNPDAGSPKTLRRACSPFITLAFPNPNGLSGSARSWASITS